MAEFYHSSISPNEMYHYGILGMKWGVRRYQNPDGSYTAEGRSRYINSRRKVKKVNDEIKAYKLLVDNGVVGIDGQSPEKELAKKKLKRARLETKYGNKYDQVGHKKRIKSGIALVDKEGNLTQAGKRMFGSKEEYSKQLMNKDREALSDARHNMLNSRKGSSDYNMYKSRVTELESRMGNQKFYDDKADAIIQAAEKEMGKSMREVKINDASKIAKRALQVGQLGLFAFNMANLIL